MPGEVVFSHSFAEVAGVHVTHQFNMSGEYKVDGLEAHAARRGARS